MNKTWSAEFKVGIFVIAGCMILIFMSLKIGKFKFFGGAKTYEVSVLFDNTEGLDVGGSVQISGVVVGRVKDIKLDGKKAKVILELGENIILKKDAYATIKTKGVLGEKFVEIYPGDAEEVIPKNGEIVNIKKTMDIDKLLASVDTVMEDIKAVTANLRKTLGGDEGEIALKGIRDNLYELTLNINRLVKKNDESLTNTVKNLEKFSAVLAEKTPELSDELKEITKNLKELLNENRGNVKESIENIKKASERLDQTLASIKSVSEKIDKGEGTLGKLINDDTVHENLNKTLSSVNKMLSKANSTKTFLEFKSEYLQRLKDSRTHINLKIYPKTDYFYMIGGVDSPNGRLSRKTERVTGLATPVYTTTETETERSLLINAQIGKRFHNIEFRGGLFESTGGIGLDLYTHNDKWKHTFEIYDFDKKYNPHVKIGTNYNLFKYLFLSAGLDDIISDRKRRSIYVGGGIKFEDEDIKYLLTSAPIPTK
jgi:phospholipid/cholesterol/gamma-HCH transport system substrate-binding protein